MHLSFLTNITLFPSLLSCIQYISVPHCILHHHHHHYQSTLPVTLPPPPPLPSTNSQHSHSHSHKRLHLSSFPSPFLGHQSTHIHFHGDDRQWIGTKTTITITTKTIQANSFLVRSSDCLFPVRDAAKQGRGGAHEGIHHAGEFSVWVTLWLHLTLNP